MLQLQISEDGSLSLFYEVVATTVISAHEMECLLAFIVEVGTSLVS